MLEKSKLHMVIPCAGSGARTKLKIAKQFYLIAGKQTLDYTLATIQQIRQLQRIILVLAPQTIYQPQIELAQNVEIHQIGGASRAESVLNALLKLAETEDLTDWVLVHDAARCLITAPLINHLIDSCWQHNRGGLLALPLADTLKQVATVNEINLVEQTITRANKWLAQTPQMFRLGQLIDALQQAKQNNLTITDEAAAMEQLGYQPLIVLGSKFNFKITYPEDLALARLLINHHLLENN